MIQEIKLKIKEKIIQKKKKKKMKKKKIDYYTDN